MIPVFKSVDNISRYTLVCPESAGTVEIESFFATVPTAGDYHQSRLPAKIADAISELRYLGSAFRAQQVVGHLQASGTARWINEADQGF
ncbi:MAG TPA: hypothetical protein ENI11_04485 [Actinobacteria bacterium]|nr:hypothetical protein [Actinomycetota bacterium]